jgi:hypothetical protein
MRGLAILAAAAALAACGSDDDASAGNTLSGVAAVGEPIAGAAVKLSCAGGTPLNTTTSGGGLWQVVLSGQTLPCAVQVSGGTVGGAANALTLHSLALNLGHLNITPLTDLVLASQVGGDPQAWFGTPAFADIDAASLDAAAARVATALGIGSALGSRDPLTAAFSPVAGDPIDDVLEALNAALQSLGAGYEALLAAAGSGDFAAFAGLPAAVADALDTHGGGGGGSTTCTTGTPMIFARGQATGPYTDGQEVCVEASTTSLKIDSKSFANPTQNTNVPPPYSGYVFADAGLNYEVVFKDGALYEINVAKPNAMSAADFHGQFAATAGLLTIELSVNGAVIVSLPVPGDTAPASQAEFCADPDSDPYFGVLQGQSGVSLAITDCNFANNVGTLNGIAQPGSLPFQMKFTWGG